MLRLVLVFSIVVSIAGCAVGAATSGRVVIKDDNVAVDVRFSDRDRELIDGYYGAARGGHRRKGLPPGLAKRGGDLPPGLAKRDRLPPGLRGAPLPYDLERQLSRLPDNYVRVRVGGDIVLMDGRTRVIFDVIHGVGD